jgi:OHCU decarboxylase
MDSIERLNASGATRFGEALRPLFEAARPLANALYAQRPFASYAGLIDAAEGLAHSMSVEDQAEILSAHPRIGANPASVSAASYREQGYASEADCADAEVERVYDQLAKLNERYEQKFGFRFVVFVNRRPKSEIVEVLRRRLENTREQELETGLRDMFLIARDRLANAT